MHPPGGREVMGTTHGCGPPRGPDASRRRGLLVAALLSGVGCGTDGGVTPAPTPAILASAVADNPSNVLSAVVTGRVRGADSVAVRYGVAGSALDSATPAVTLAVDSVLVPVLGLLPDTRYLLRFVAYAGDQTILGDTVGFATGTLPADLPRYVADGADPSPGYVVFATGLYGLVIDNGGRVVWYHRFSPYGPGLNFEAQPTGRYVARPSVPDPTVLPHWVEIDPLGTVTRTFGCAGGLSPRFHDLIAEPDGAYWIMCDETRTMDLSGLGGVANAQVMGTVVQHVSSEGDLLFQWDPFDHFEITDLVPASRTGSSVNWMHGNSLDLDTDGNLIVSFRSLSEITKIDTRTGAVLWRMGGLKNQFVFQDAGAPAFSFQHGVRLTAPAHLLLLDNLGDPTASRAERYVYDAELHTAQLVASYGPSPGVTAQLGGSTQDLPGGRTLVSFGPAGRVEEYDASGQVVWHIEGNPGYVFRAQRIRSLYRPGVGSPR
ncbi:MAG: hypothetical protein DMD51_04045 [Gemmatimonadetes bacterium]|nr:MAG: hypothetical protein DMD51_04045 [Gemmatimonadota bacterium]